MQRTYRIGTRESQLAVWQATRVKELLSVEGIPAELIFIKSDGDIDLKTPLYEMGVQGIFTKVLDIALLNGQIDLAVHSMKDVPTRLPAGIKQAAVLERGPVADLLVVKTDDLFLSKNDYAARIATSSIRRRAQWLHRYPNHEVVNLRGNVNTRLQKLQAEDWDAAIFALAGLERIELRPSNSIVLDWMLPAPAQGAIMVSCRDTDESSLLVCEALNHKPTAICTKIERDFLRSLMGGCSTPVSALAELDGDEIYFRGSVVSHDGKIKLEAERILPIELSDDIGRDAAHELIEQGVSHIIPALKHERS